MLQIGLDTGKVDTKKWIIADGRLNIGFKWTSLEHMNDTTNDLAALAQRQHMK
jgi:hypothetical protein